MTWQVITVKPYKFVVKEENAYFYLTYLVLLYRYHMKTHITTLHYPPDFICDINSKIEVKRRERVILLMYIVLWIPLDIVSVVI